MNNNFFFRAQIQTSIWKQIFLRPALGNLLRNDFTFLEKPAEQSTKVISFFKLFFIFFFVTNLELDGEIKCLFCYLFGTLKQRKTSFLFTKIDLFSFSYICFCNQLTFGSTATDLIKLN